MHPGTGAPSTAVRRGRSKQRTVTLLRFRRMTVLAADLQGQSRQLGLLWRLVEDISSELALEPC